jgi:lipoprotein NlpI
MGENEQLSSLEAKALELQEIGRFDLLLSVFDQLLELDPQSAFAHAVAGVAAM